jgi:hypothetical protein
MRENAALGHSSERRSRCEINHLFDGASCLQAAQEKVDGLLLCERHALEAKLEGQIACWDEMLFHIDLWSGEASRKNRMQIVELLDVERATATAAMEWAYEDLDALRSGTPWGKVLSRRRESARRDSLLVLPPRGARPPSRGLRRLRRR